MCPTRGLHFCGRRCKCILLDSPESPQQTVSPHRVALRIRKWERVCKRTRVARWIISKQGFLMGGHPSAVTKFGLYSFLIGDMKDLNITRACRLSGCGPHTDHRCLLFCLIWVLFIIYLSFFHIYFYFLCFVPYLWQLGSYFGSFFRQVALLLLLEHANS